MVFHNQKRSIDQEIEKLDEILSYMDMQGHILHTGPLIRREAVYSSLSIDERRKILNAFLSFYRKIGIDYHTFIVPKNPDGDQHDLIRQLSTQIIRFFSNHKELTENPLVVYYDNGQTQVSHILAAVFSLYDCEFRKIMPKDYRLFQIADLITGVELIEYKRKNKTNSLSEKMFFDSMDRFKKTYLKTIREKVLE